MQHFFFSLSFSFPSFSTLQNTILASGSWAMCYFTDQNSKSNFSADNSLLYYLDKYFLIIFYNFFFFFFGKGFDWISISLPPFSLSQRSNPCHTPTIAPPCPQSSTHHQEWKSCPGNLTSGEANTSLPRKENLFVELGLVVEVRKWLVRNRLSQKLTEGLPSVGQLKLEQALGRYQLTDEDIMAAIEISSIPCDHLPVVHFAPGSQYPGLHHPVGPVDPGFEIAGRQEKRVRAKGKISKLVNIREMAKQSAQQQVFTKNSLVYDVRTYYTYRVSKITHSLEHNA
jgi:hypothetical protein